MEVLVVLRFVFCEDVNGVSLIKVSCIRSFTEAGVSASPATLYGGLATLFYYL